MSPTTYRRSRSKAYRIADNQTATLSEWNYELLPIELKDLQAADFNLELLGFDAEELAKLLGGGVKDGLTDPDEIPAPPDEPITKPGDLWLLGAYVKCPHCGEENPI